MNILYVSIEYIASFIEMFIVYKYYSIFFYEKHRSHNRKTDIILALIGTGITQFCNSISIFSYYTILVAILYISISASLIYKIHYIALLSIASFYVLILGCFEFLIFTLVSNCFEGYDTFLELIYSAGFYRMIMLLLIKFLWILAYLGLKKYLHKLILKKNFIYTILILSCIGFLEFMYLVEQTFETFNNNIEGRWFVLFAFIALLLFISCFTSLFREEKMKLYFSETRNKLLEDNYKTVNGLYNSNAKLYHDLNNHLNILYQLLDESDNESAKAYIEQISQPIKELSKTVWTGVDIVDAIINSKLEKMKEKSISVKLNVEFPPNSNILPNDMCTILSNLLDNAIDAVELLEHPGTIELTLRKINHFLLIKIVNPCVSRQRKFELFPQTTKDNKVLHGWGLRSVKDAVDKYNGTITCSNEDNMFIVTIMLCFEIL